MYIKSLKITDKSGIVRDISFKMGLNLIIDETPISSSEDLKKTGNNIGKTTVLKLIDYCLGANKKTVYTSEENKSKEYKLVKEYLENEEVLITLTLCNNLYKSTENDIIIKRNFLSGNRNIRKINGEDVLDKHFENHLKTLLYPDLEAEKPSFRQLISKNVRYNEKQITNTLKTLDHYTTSIEYETLNLYLFGIVFNEGDRKQKLVTKLSNEYDFKKRLESTQTKSAYEATLNLLKSEISVLQKKRSSLNINENYEHDLDELDNIKVHKGTISSVISNLRIKHSLILESKNDLEKDKSSVDIPQLKQIYSQFKAFNMDTVIKSFEDLVKYHNNMIHEKVKFISSELPKIESDLNYYEAELKDILQQESILSNKIANSEPFEELEKLSFSLNEKYQKKGEYESLISQIEKVEQSISEIEHELECIGSDLYSNESGTIIKKQLDKFNHFFSSVSTDLYEEQYLLKADIQFHKKSGQKFYDFDSFNANMSSGKKQGEILCFDLAYILFARSESIPALNFLLNDKKELLHNNQLMKVSEFIEKNKIQLIISVLKDKIPSEIASPENVILTLSQDNKLFKIENKHLPKN